MHHVGRRASILERIIPAYAGNAAYTRCMSTASTDHPRVCGECSQMGCTKPATNGSSPRMRGMRQNRQALAVSCRIIPAYAGNAQVSAYAPLMPSDHPRVCGECASKVDVHPWSCGSSPRMRGMRTPSPSRFRLHRIIPAYAGNARANTSRPAAHADHPRVCGECWLYSIALQFSPGSSPRMRGMHNYRIRVSSGMRIIPAYAGNAQPTRNHRHSDTDHPRVCGECVEVQPSIAVPLGSSPRMRGMLVQLVGAVLCQRIIPAYAGNAGWDLTATTVATDHPRVCGECNSGIAESVANSGSSPRMRGMHPPTLIPACAHRIIPAYAGNATSLTATGAMIADHPRVCGECGFCQQCLPLHSGSSPRMRGMLQHLKQCGQDSRIIPAYAGNAITHREAQVHRTDHPRVCGECMAGHRYCSCPNGSSPRMRGMRDSGEELELLPRIIPAYAGNAAIQQGSLYCKPDHPRVCGECHSVRNTRPSSNGSSPRMRGMPGFR